MPELKWKEPKKIPDGKHTGTIIGVAYRHEPYEYTDVTLQPDDATEIELRYGCPTILTENSKLGRLLRAFGIQPKIGESADPEKVLIGKRVSFMTINKPGRDNREYAEVVEDSVKPLVESEKVD